MCEFVFLSEWSWCHSVVLHMEALFISFYYYKIHCKKNVILYQKKFCLIEENCFWWVLLWDCFVVSVFFLHVVASVLAGGKVVQCLIWFEVVFFYSFDDFFFQWFDEIQSWFFSPVVFLWDFLSCFFKKRKVFSCWFVKKVFVEWIGLFVEWVVGEFVFFLIAFFFWMGLKIFFSMKEVFLYVSFFHSS